MDSAMGDYFDEHWLDSLDAEEHRMLSCLGQDGSSGSSWVSAGWSTSPDAGYSFPVVSAAAASSRNVVVTGNLRGRKLNDKLYALRSVVPSITKLDKVSIIRDAVEYVQHLQEQERQLLAEISILESAAPATHGQLLGTVEWGASAVVLQDSYADHAVPPMKKMRSFCSSSSAVTPGASTMAATSHRIEALEVSVTAAGDKVLLVSVACRHRKDAMAKVCLALDGLPLAVISSNITSVSGTLKHTALVQSGDIPHSKMKEVIETAITQVDVVGSTLSTMSY